MKTYLILGILVLLIIALMIFIRSVREHFLDNACVIKNFGPVKISGDGIPLSAQDILNYKGVLCLNSKLADKKLSLFTLPELTTDINNDLSTIKGSDIDKICNNTKYKISCSTAFVAGNSEGIANFLSTIAHQLSPRGIKNSEAPLSAKNRSARSYIITNPPTNKTAPGCGDISSTGVYC